MEFKKENLNKPLEVIRLEDARVQEGKALTGDNNTIAILVSKKKSNFFKSSNK